MVKCPLLPQTCVRGAKFERLNFKGKETSAKKHSLNLTPEGISPYGKESSISYLWNHEYKIQKNEPQQHWSMTDFRDKDPTQLKNKMKTKEKRKRKVSGKPLPSEIIF